MRACAVLILMAPVVVCAEAVVYRIAPAAGDRVALEVEKTGLLHGKKHLFEFGSYEGQLQFDHEHPENSRVELSISGASATCKDTWVKPSDVVKVVDAALNDMMDVRNHPRLLFTSGKVVPRGENQFEVQGPLTIRGIARPALVVVTLTGSTPDSLTFAGSSEVRLKDYGLRPPSAALGTIGTKNEMQVRFQLTARAAPR